MTRRPGLADIQAHLKVAFENQGVSTIEQLDDTWLQDSTDVGGSIMHFWKFRPGSEEQDSYIICEAIVSDKPPLTTIEWV